MYIDWSHGKQLTGAVLTRVQQQGLVIGFDREIDASTLSTFTFRAFVRQPGSYSPSFTTFLWLELDATVAGIPAKVGDASWSVSCGNLVGAIPPPSGDVASGPVIGARLLPSGDGKPAHFVPGVYRVVLHGDAVLGVDQIVLPDGRKVHPAVDANHLGPGIPGRCPTGDTAEGGLFESWFTIGGQ